MLSSISRYSLFHLLVCLALLTGLSGLAPAGAGENSPSNPSRGGPESVQAEQASSPPSRSRDLPDLASGTLQTEEYVVKEGDWIAKILRKKGVLKDSSSLPELLKVLRKLNSSLHDLDMIRPGEKIVVLVKVVPSGEGKQEAAQAPALSPEQGPPGRLKSVAYRVKRGDILSRVVMGRFDISSKKFISEYLNLFRECNPGIKNPNHIMVGQVIRLPLYPPAHEEIPGDGLPLRDLDKSGGSIAVSPARGKPVVVKAQPAPSRKDQRPEPAAPEAQQAEKKIPLAADDLGYIVSRMGEEWIHSGEHFIPLKSSGYINLRAESYPIIRLNRGITVIVDLHSALSDKMTRVIETNWATYRVVRLSAGDDLRSALEKILRAFRYPRMLGKGKPISLGGAIPVSITGDWILSPPAGSSGTRREFIVINLLGPGSKGTPGVIKEYLRPLGVEIIEYPQVDEGGAESAGPSMVEKAEDPRSIVRDLLSLTGREFTEGEKIEAFTSADNNFRFTVEGDFYLEPRGKKLVIDLSGLDPEVVALLKDSGISVLTLKKEHDPLKMVSRTLEFLRVSFRPGPHLFVTNPGSRGGNVRLTMKGIMFYGPNGEPVLATSLDLPPEIGAFLAQRGYRVLVVS